MPADEALSYVDKGYCPIHIGDLLNGKYEIVHKLGHGADATVWLAFVHYPPNPLSKDSESPKSSPPLATSTSEDMSAAESLSSTNTSKTPDDDDPRELSQLPKYVCIKILQATHCVLGIEHVRELQIHKHIVDMQLRSFARHEGENFVISLLEIFQVISGNGTHACLVMPFHGFCVRDVQGLELWKRKELSRQVVQGVAYLHQLGVCHADLTASNVIVQVNMIQTWSVKDIYTRLGDPVKVPFPKDYLTQTWDDDDDDDDDKIKALDKATLTKPIYTVPAISQARIRGCLHLFTPRAKIIDFGSAFRFSDRSTVFQKRDLPIFYPVPEIVLGMDVDRKIDLWSLGCLIFQICTNEIFFRGPYCGGFQKYWDEEEAITSMRRVMGSVPGDIDGFEDREIPFENRRRAIIRSVRTITKLKLAERVQAAVGSQENRDLGSLWELLAGLLMFNPELRWEADFAAHCRWFTRA